MVDRKRKKEGAYHPFLRTRRSYQCAFYRQKKKVPKANQKANQKATQPVKGKPKQAKGKGLPPTKAAPPKPDKTPRRHRSERSDELYDDNDEGQTLPKKVKPARRKLEPDALRAQLLAPADIPTDEGEDDDDEAEESVLTKAERAEYRRAFLGDDESDDASSSESDGGISAEPAEPCFTDCRFWERAGEQDFDYAQATVEATQQRRNYAKQSGPLVASLTGRAPTTSRKKPKPSGKQKTTNVPAKAAQPAAASGSATTEKKREMDAYTDLRGDAEARKKSALLTSNADMSDMPRSGYFSLPSAISAVADRNEQDDDIWDSGTEDYDKDMAISRVSQQPYQGLSVGPTPHQLTYLSAVVRANPVAAASLSAMAAASPAGAAALWASSSAATRAGAATHTSPACVDAYDTYEQPCEASRAAAPSSQDTEQSRKQHHAASYADSATASQQSGVATGTSPASVAVRALSRSEPAARTASAQHTQQSPRHATSSHLAPTALPPKMEAMLADVVKTVKSNAHAVEKNSQMLQALPMLARQMDILRHGLGSTRPVSEAGVPGRSSIGCCLSFSNGSCLLVSFIFSQQDYEITGKDKAKCRAVGREAEIRSLAVGARALEFLQTEHPEKYKALMDRLASVTFVCC